VDLIAKSRRLPAFHIAVTIDDQGTTARNLSEVRGILQGYCEDFGDALRHPLWYEKAAAV
jgi:hypothetical protein